MNGIPWQNQKLLREKAYVDDSHLSIRYRTHELYTLDPVDYRSWTLERLASREPLQGNERILDVGCARGDLLRGLVPANTDRGALVGFDLSPGMIAAAKGLAAGQPIHFFVGDAQSMPFADQSFDVVMACHMLYHVPDIDRAVAEAARVLRPGGRYLATTNSANTMPEYQTLFDRAAARFPAVLRKGRLSPDRFSLENGAAFLEAHFGQVDVHSLDGKLRFPTAKPFMDYFGSMRSLRGRPGHSDEEWQALLEFAQAEVESIIAHEGHFDVSKLSGAFVAVKEP